MPDQLPPFDYRYDPTPMPEIVDVGARDMAVVHFIVADLPYRTEELLELWHRTGHFVAFESIVGIAAERHMPLWAAEQEWRQWWEGFKAENADWQ